jgi:hypothetical protein
LREIGIRVALEARRADVLKRFALPAAGISRPSKSEHSLGEEEVA